MKNFYDSFPKTFPFAICSLLSCMPAMADTVPTPCTESTAITQSKPELLHSQECMIYWNENKQTFLAKNNKSHSIRSNSADKTAPKLVSIELSSTSLDVTQQEQSLEVTIVVSDESRIDYSPFWFVNKDFAGRRVYQDSVTPEWVATATANEYQASFTYTFDAESHPGTWVADLQSIKDGAGNYNHYPEQDIDLPTLQIVNNKDIDVTPPVIKSFSVNPKVVDVTNGAKTVTLSLAVEDETGPKDHQLFWLKSFNTYDFNGFATATWSFNQNTSLWESSMEFTIEPDAMSGTWGLTNALILYDNNRNYTDLYGSHLNVVKAEFEPYITIINDAQETTDSGFSGAVDYADVVKSNDQAKASFSLPLNYIDGSTYKLVAYATEGSFVEGYDITGTSSLASACNIFEHQMECDITLGGPGTGELSIHLDNFDYEQDKVRIALIPESLESSWTNNYTNLPSNDIDGDGISNAVDSDDDNDGINDSIDVFPLNRLESSDNDMDGIGDNEDTDDDNDGLSDAEDSMPLNPNPDTDKDGVEDQSDKTPYGVTQTDFNSDGLDDILYRHDSTLEWKLDLTGFGGAFLARNYLQMSTCCGWVFNGTGDFNGDGFTDVIIRNSTSGKWYVYNMDSHKVLSKGYIPLESAVDSSVQAVADFNHDGFADVLLRNEVSGEWNLSLLQDRQVVNEITLPMSSVLSWKIVAAQDFDNNGSADILIRNTNSGAWYMYLYQGTEVISQGYVSGLSTDLNLVIEAVADFNADGSNDVLFRNNQSNEWMVSQLNGRQVASTGLVLLPQEANYQFNAAGKYNSDTSTDITLINTDTGAMHLYYLNGLDITESKTLSQSDSSEFKVKSLVGW